jgi:chorismate mutase
MNIIELVKPEECKSGIYHHIVNVYVTFKSTKTKDLVEHVLFRADRKINPELKKYYKD